MVLSRLFRIQEHVGSNPAFPTNAPVAQMADGVGLKSLSVVGSNPPGSTNVGIAQWLVRQLATLGMAVRFCLPTQKITMGYGVMVTRNSLKVKFFVRIKVPQQNFVPKHKLATIYRKMYRYVRKLRNLFRWG